MFHLTYQPDEFVAIGQNAAETGIFKAKQDVYKADTLRQLNDLKNSGIAATTDEDKNKFIKLGQEQIDSGEVAGYFGHEEAQGARQEWVTRYATDSIKALQNPAARLAAATPAPPENESAAGKLVYDKLIAAGLPQHGAAGLAGRLQVESHFDPNARNPGDGSDGSDSIGIGQWNSDRAIALKAFAAAQGKPWNDLGVQADFIVHELNGSEGKAGAALEAAGDIRGGATAALGYEKRPRGWEGGLGTAVGGGQTLHYAQNAYASWSGDKNAQPVAGPSHLLPFVPEGERQTLVASAGRDWADHDNASTQAAKTEKATVKSLVQDDAASIANTGIPVASVTHDRVAMALGDAAANDLDQTRAVASSFFAKTKDFEQLPSVGIGASFDALRPSGGLPAFTQQQYFYEQAQKKADETLKQRTADPAAAVLKSPGVQLANADYSKSGPADSASYYPVLRARMNAQQALGMGITSPITNDEAKVYADRLRPVEETGGVLAGAKETVEGVLDDVQRKYGPYAEQAMARVLYQMPVKQRCRPDGGRD